MFPCRRASGAGDGAAAPRASCCTRAMPSPAGWIHTMVKGEPSPVFHQLILLCQALQDGADPTDREQSQRALGRVLALSCVETHEHTPLARLHGQLARGETIDRDHLTHCIIALQSIQAKLTGLLPSIKGMLAREMSDTPNQHLIDAIAFLEPFESVKPSRDAARDLERWDPPRLALLLFNKRGALTEKETVLHERLQPMFDAITQRNELSEVTPFLKELRELRLEQQGLVARIEYKMRYTIREAELKLKQTIGDVKGEAEPVPQPLLNLFEALEAFEDGVNTDEKRARLDDCCAHYDGLREELGFTTDENRAIDNILRDIRDSTSELIDPNTPKECLALLSATLIKHRGALAKVLLNVRAMSQRLMRRAPTPLRLLVAEMGVLLLKTDAAPLDRRKIGEPLQEMLPLLPGYVGRALTRSEQNRLRRCSEMLLDFGAPIDQEELATCRTQLLEMVEQIQTGSLFTSFDTVREEMLGPNGELHRTIHRISQGMVDDLTRQAPSKLVDLSSALEAMLKELRENRFDFKKIESRYVIASEVLREAHHLVEESKVEELRARTAPLCEDFEALIEIKRLAEAPETLAEAKKRLENSKERLIEALIGYNAHLFELIATRQGMIAKVIQTLGTSALQTFNRLTGRQTSVPSTLPPLQIVMQSENSFVQLLANYPFKFARGPIVKMLEQMPNHVEPTDRERVAKACKEVALGLQEMETFSFARAYALFQKIAELHPVFDGIYEMTPAEEGANVSKELLALLRSARELQSERLCEAAGGKVQEWVSTHGSSLETLVLGGAPTRRSDALLCTQIGKALDDCLENIDESRSLRIAGERLERALLLHPGLSRSGVDQLTSRVRKRNAALLRGSEEASLEPEERLAKSRENFVKTLPLHATYRFACWILPEFSLTYNELVHTTHVKAPFIASADPLVENIQQVWGSFVALFTPIDHEAENALDLLELACPTSLRGRIAYYSIQVIYRISRWLTTSHIVPTIEATTLNLASHLSEDTAQAFGRAQTWGNQYVEATKDAQNGPIHPRGFLDSRAEYMAQRQGHPRIMRKLKKTISEVVVPQIDLADSFEMSEKAIVKWIENPNLQHDLVDLIFANATRMILSVLRTMMMGFSSLAHRLIVWSVRGVLLVTNVAENFVQKTIKSVIANSSDIDKIMIAFSEQIDRFDLMRKEKEEEIEHGEDKESVRVNVQKQMEGFIHAFLTMLNASKVVDRNQAFDPKSINFLDVPMPDQKILSNLRNLIIEYGAGVVTDIWQVSGRDPHTTAQMLQEFLFSSTNQLSRNAKSSRRRLVYAGRSHPQVKGYAATVQAALKTFLDHAIRRVHGSFGESERRLLAEHIEWLRAELIPTGTIAYSLPQDLSEQLDAFKGEDLQGDLQTLANVEASLIDFQNEYERGYQSFSNSGLGSLTSRELRRIRYTLDASFASIHNAVERMQAQLSAIFEDQRKLFTDRMEEDWIESFAPFVEAETIDAPDLGRLQLRSIETRKKVVQTCLSFDVAYVPSESAIEYQSAMRHMLACQSELVAARLNHAHIEELMTHLTEEALDNAVDDVLETRVSILTLIEERGFTPLKLAFEREFKNGVSRSKLQTILLEFQRSMLEKVEESREAYGRSIDRTAASKARGADECARLKEDKVEVGDIRSAIREMVEIARAEIQHVDRLRVNILDSLGLLDWARNLSATTLQSLSSRVISILKGEDQIARSAGFALIDFTSSRVTG